jgi:hypothetical protein
VFALWVWRERQWRILSDSWCWDSVLATIPSVIRFTGLLSICRTYKIADIPRPLDWLTPDAAHRNEGLHRTRVIFGYSRAVYSGCRMDPISLVPS